MKTALAVIFLLAGLAAIGLGVASAPAAAQTGHRVPTVVMRALPSSVGVEAVVAAKLPPPADDLVPLAPRPAEPKPLEPHPAEPKAAEPRPAELAPVEAKADKPRPAAAEAKPAPVANKPPPAARPPPTAFAPAPAAGGGADASGGSLNLRASDTADVFIDGRKVGGSPVLGHKVKAGKHKVRFDCYDPSGEPKTGTTQTVEVAADAERDVEYECPAP